MSELIYLNGKLVPREDARVSVYDRGLLYGDGIFEGIRAYDGRIFRLEEHLKRLERSAKAIMLELPISRQELAGATVQACRANQIRDGYIRLVVTRGEDDLGLDPTQCLKPTVFIIAASIQLYPEELYKKGLELVTVSTRRNSPNSLDPGIKSLNYLNNILAKIETNLAGVSEGIMLTQDGMVCECTGDNIFICKGGVLITPPVEAGILDGVTRRAVLECAQAHGVETRETLFPVTEVHTADECFLTGTAAEVVPVVKVDGRVIGDGKPGSLTRRLMSDFHELTKSEGTPIYD